MVPAESHAHTLLLVFSLFHLCLLVFSVSVPVTVSGLLLFLEVVGQSITLPCSLLPLVNSCPI